MGKKGEKIEKKYIELGISDGKYTEITQGLTKDDKIVQNDSANWYKEGLSYWVWYPSGAKRNQFGNRKRRNGPLIMGASGSGKSTLMNIIGLLDT